MRSAIQGGCDYASSDTGFYVGNWNSNVNFIPDNSIEVDLYGGYKFQSGPLDFDTGVLTYVYPGNRAPNTTELYAGVKYSDEQLGAFTAKYSHTVSRDYFNYAGAFAGRGLSGRGTGYFNLSYSKLLAPNVTVKASIGLTQMSSDIRSLGYKSYADYSAGATYDVGGGLTVTGAVQGGNHQSTYVLPTEGASVSVNKTRVIVSLAKTF